MAMTLLDLFSGIGGFSLAARWAGIRTVQFVEIDPFCQMVLRKNFPGVPIHDDIKTFRAESGSADIVSGGFPCQDISFSNHKGKGLAGQRSGLWYEMLRIINDVLPRYIVVENVANLLRRGLGDVLGSMAEIGYDAEWHCIPASFVGSCHHRDRLWIIAYPSGSNVEGLDFPKPFFAYQEESRRRELARAIDAALPADDYAEMRGNYDGVSAVMDRLKCLGNAIVPQIAYEIFKAILKVEREWGTSRKY